MPLRRAAPVFPPPISLSPPISLFAALLVMCAVCALAQPASGLAASYQTGIGDEQAEMFTNPLYQQLGTRIARDIVPYDVAVQPADLATFRLWYQSARADGVQPLIAFYHSRVTPLSLPSVTRYKLEVAKFIRMFPAIRSYEPWNEANRGEVAGQFRSPSASLAARYYLALTTTYGGGAPACRGCQVVGLDVLDGNNIKPTIVYIKQFERALRAARKPLPTIWGLHNYSDTNRFRSAGTRAVLADTHGTVWLTETGGIAKLKPSFPWSLSRQARATSYMFKLASLSSRITRLYIFQWTGGHQAKERFDAGLSDYRGRPRPAYCVVYEQLLHKKRCNVKPVSD